MRIGRSASKEDKLLKGLGESAGHDRRTFQGTDARSVIWPFMPLDAGSSYGPPKLRCRSAVVPVAG